MVTVIGEQVNLEAGLYDAKGILLASWDELINEYGVDFESVRNYPGDKSNTALGTIINNNEELRAAFELRLPEDYTTIQRFAFSDCKTLNRVIIAQNITSIGDGAFAGCESLIEVCNKSSLDIVAGSESGVYGGVATEAKQVITAESQTKLKMVGDFVFYDDGIYAALVKYTGDNTEITLPVYEEDYTIYASTFRNNTNITSVNIPEGVTMIANEVFAFCTSLTNINIPEGVTEIDGLVFVGCTSLTSVSIPLGMMTIGHDAFYECTSLSTINFNGTIEQWGTVSLGFHWNYGVPATEVICTDGSVPL